VTLVLAAFAAVVFAAHASWPWALGREPVDPPTDPPVDAEVPTGDRSRPSPIWLQRSPRWALGTLAAAAIAGAAALLADVDRRLVLGDLWRWNPLRFALIATVGLALADLVLLLSPRGSRERRGTFLIGLLGAASLFGVCWVFEVARGWGASTPRTIAAALALAAAAALLVRPNIAGGWTARLAGFATATCLAAYAVLGAPEAAMTPDGATLRVAPLAAAAALAATEPWIPRRLRGFCRGLAIALALIALRSAWAEASVSVPFSTQPQPSIPKF
jgi:hypothetical protein